MAVTEQRRRDYRWLRRNGYRARTAAWLTSTPRYDVPGAYEAQVDRYEPEQWRRGVEPGTGDPSVVTVDGEDFIVAYVFDDEPYDWGDLDPTDEDRAAIEPRGVCVVRVADGADSAVWGCGLDLRLPPHIADRDLRQTACELIDEIAYTPVACVAPLLLPMGVTR